ncbi:MAG: FecR domain-containing protein [Bacteroidetes bacterium]|nr:FecR domain-containing protein [Bacteroidota bacterium]
MEQDPTYFEELIARYFSGEAMPAEITELTAWVEEDPEHKTVFMESQYAWMSSEQIRVAEAANIDLEWEEFQKRAGIVKDHDESDDRFASDDRDGRDKNLAFSPFHHFAISSILMRAAAVLLILALPSFLLFRYLNKPVIKELAANTGRMEALLPDGSKVILNTGAVIKYPETFNGKKRAVSLEGEAYFDVAHNASKPFIIATDGIRVEVRGTSFYINTRSMSGDFELVLTTGKVELYFENQPGGARVLKPGERAVIHGDQIIINANQDANYMAWKTHRIAFNNDPLNSVAATLSKVYQADIRLSDPALAQCRLTATFDNQSLESVLNVIKATLDVNIRDSGSLVEISGKGCR